MLIRDTLLSEQYDINRNAYVNSGPCPTVASLSSNYLFFLLAEIGMWWLALGHWERYSIPKVAEQRDACRQDVYWPKVASFWTIYLAGNWLLFQFKQLALNWLVSWVGATATLPPIERDCCWAIGFSQGCFVLDLTDCRVPRFAMAASSKPRKLPKVAASIIFKLSWRTFAVSHWQFTVDSYLQATVGNSHSWETNWEVPPQRKQHAANTSEVRPAHQPMVRAAILTLVLVNAKLVS